VGKRELCLLFEVDSGLCLSCEVADVLVTLNKKA